MKHSFLVAYSKPASPFILGLRPACAVSCGHGVGSPRFGGARREQHFLLEGLPWLRDLDTKKLTWLPGSEVFSQQMPPPPQHTGCHHLSMAWRHSLSQQMRGLSERAPQFLGDCGEGGSRHARLWFLPTILLFVQAGPDNSTMAVNTLSKLDMGKRMTSSRQVFFLVQWAHFGSQCVSYMAFEVCDGSVISDTKECPCWVKHYRTFCQGISHHKTKSLKASI